jgi:hypothetical protein
LIGGVLAGPAGAIIGGVTGSRHEVRNVSAVILCFRMMDEAHETRIEMYRRGFFKGYSAYEAPMVVKRLSNAIEAAKQKEASKVTSHVKSSEPLPSSLTDQIKSLADLQKQGLLTAKEFAAAKKRILGL